MKLAASLTLALVTATAIAQRSPTSDDPANLRGERVRPLTGLELPIDRGAAGLQQMLLKLRTRASLMMIVAHPDDEDGGMLTFEARGHGVRAAMLTLTRGEGGQNLMTGDFNDALGLIRTQELLAADRYFGIDQMFGTEVDFGFSKTKEETLAQWTHDRCLYDAVRAVRLFRPLVITSVFVGGPTDGHGQHQVSGQMAQEVFNAAADPKAFPEMGLEPWAPFKVYARVPFAQAGRQGLLDYATGKYVPVRFYNYVTKQWTEAMPHADVLIHEGEFSDALGMTYVQFAREGLALQKTQIGAGIRVPPSGAYDVGYTLYGSRVARAQDNDFFGGIDTSLAGIADLAPGAPPFLRTELKRIAADTQQAIDQFKPAQPALSAPFIATALQHVNSLIAQVSGADLTLPQRTNILHELRIKQAQMEAALALSFGVSIEATARTADAIAGSQVPVPVKVTTSSAQTFSVKNIWLENAIGSATTPNSSDREVPDLTSAHPVTRLLTARPFFTTNITRPYFSRSSVETPVYTVSSAPQRNAPSSQPALTAFATLTYRGVDFTIARIVHSDTQPLAFIPPVSLSMPSPAIVAPSGTSTLDLRVRVHTEATTSPATGTLSLSAPPSLRFTPPRLPLRDAPATFAIRLPPAAPRSAKVTATAHIGAGAFSEGFLGVGYTGITRTNLFYEASTRIVPVDVRVAPNLRVAYLAGTGDEVQALLENIGVHASTLSVTDIAQGKLSAFDVLIVGVRAYTAHPDLLPVNRNLLDFAKAGGTVIVQYQAHAFHASDAPFPINLAGDGEKVIEELAKVQLTSTPSGVLSFPNKITSADFDAWVSERGHGFPGTWDAAYEAPTETHDADQDAQRGGLLIARTGKGFYVYTAFALYRQLPEAVPGAYRLFANLISLGRRP